MQLATWPHASGFVFLIFGCAAAMACQDIDAMRQEVCSSLRGTVNTWQYNLQAKWGDPRVYEAERTERLRQDARVVYDLNRRNTELLSDAYTTRADKQREQHQKRMEELKRRGYRSASTHPQSEQDPAHTQLPSEPQQTLAPAGTAHP